MDGPVPDLKVRQCFGLIASPHACCHNARRVALGADGVVKMTAPIGAVGKDLAGIFRQRIWASFAVVDIGGRDRNFLYQRRIRIGADMGLEAVNRWLAFMLDPMRIAIPFAGGCDNRRSDESAGLDPDRPGLELAGDRLEQGLVRRKRPVRRLPCRFRGSTAGVGQSW